MLGFAFGRRECAAVSVVVWGVCGVVGGRGGVWVSGIVGVGMGVDWREAALAWGERYRL